MPGRKNRILWISAVILVACAISWFRLYGPNSSAPSYSARSELRQAPPFSLKDGAGALHTLQETRGKITVVHFWAAWCPPCLQEIPDLVEFAEHFQKDRLRVIAISLDEKREDAEKVLSSSKLPGNMISLLDGGAKISDAYGTYQFPETYLLNAEGRILVKLIGAQEWTGPRMEALIRQQISDIPSHLNN